MTTTEMSVDGPADSDPAPDSADAEDPLPAPLPIVHLEPATPAQAPVSIADGIERSLDPRWTALQKLTRWITAGTISGGLLVALTILLLTSPPEWVRGLIALIWLVATAVFGWLAHRWPEIEHRHSFYKVDPQGIEIRKGVVWRKVINVPRSRVQHTDVSQGPLERRYGLGTLVIYTAGTEHARIDLSGLDHATALRIRDHLLAGEGTDAV
jgi:membrane protein YdbS with pleckstrin-like domain